MGRSRKSLGLPAPRQNAFNLFGAALRRRAAEEKRVISVAEVNTAWAAELEAGGGQVSWLVGPATDENACDEARFLWEREVWLHSYHSTPLAEFASSISVAHRGAC